MPEKKSEYTPDISSRFIHAFDLVKGEVGAEKAYETVGIAASYVSHIRAGNRAPTFDHVVRICSYYKFRTEWILLGRGESRWDEKTKNFDARLSRIEKTLDNISEVISEMLVDRMIGGPKKSR